MSNKDVFLCHASEDKETIVIPFSKKLDSYGITYWLDVNELYPGDSLFDKIFKEGIAKCDYVVVFISKNFLRKEWANAELRNAITRQLRTNKKIVIPFLVDVDIDELLRTYPAFENIFCGDLKKGLDTAALQLSKIVNSTSISISSLFKRYELLSVLGWYDNEVIEKINTLSYDNLVSKCNKDLVELIYAYIFSNYSEEKQKQFLLDRLSLDKANPTESFFQVSIATNTSWSDKQQIIKRILNQYPSPQPSDFITSRIPTKDVPFFSKIKEGEFIFGASKLDRYRKDWIANPISIFLDRYEMSTVPITNEIFERFYPNHYSYRLQMNEDTSNHPVVNVNWYEASMFVIWLSQAIERISLPTEYEWEKAASWSDDDTKRIFPWGNTWKKNYCNSWYDGKRQGTTRVGIYENGKSAYGLYDMSGNVWEWCEDWFSSDWSSYFTSAIFSNPSGPITGNRKINRGGGWYKDVGMPTVYMRAGDSLMDRFPHCGFRIVKRI